MRWPTMVSGGYAADIASEEAKWGAIITRQDRDVALDTHRRHARNGHSRNGLFVHFSSCVVPVRPLPRARRPAIRA
jgi:hypothetical protein